MGQKINPVGFRLAVQRNETVDFHQPGQGGWKSRWYAKGRDFGKLVVADAAVRRHVEKKHAAAQVSRVQIDRDANGAKITVFAARPGMIIGKKGEGTERLKAELRALMGLQNVLVDVEQVSQPEADAKLIALGIASQLERRVMFRRAMRRALGSAVRLNVEGVKIMSSGRLNGLEIARTEWYREGRVPLHTLKNDIDYGFAEAKTTMGIVGVKVWISRGDRFTQQNRRVKYAAEIPEAEVADGAGGAEPAAPEGGTEKARTATIPAPAAPAPAPANATTPSGGTESVSAPTAPTPAPTAPAPTVSPAPSAPTVPDLDDDDGGEDSTQ